MPTLGRSSERALSWLLAMYKIADLSGSSSTHPGQRITRTRLLMKAGVFGVEVGNAVFASKQNEQGNNKETKPRPRARHQRKGSKRTTRPRTNRSTNEYSRCGKARVCVEIRGEPDRLLLCGNDFLSERPISGATTKTKGRQPGSLHRWWGKSAHLFRSSQKVQKGLDARGRDCGGYFLTRP